MARILTPSHINLTNLDEVISFLDQNVTFVGIQEAYPLSFSIAFALLGRNRSPSLHERKTQDTEANAVMLSPELENRIASLNHLDLHLFRHYRQILVSVRDQWYRRDLKIN
jgi:hypothetical protein